MDYEVNWQKQSAVLKQADKEVNRQQMHQYEKGNN